MAALYPSLHHQVDATNTNLTALHLLSARTPSTSSLPPKVCTPITLPSIHGGRSTRALMAMKLVDRHCVIISNTGAWPTPLSRFDAQGTFGSFGEIRCARLLAKKNSTRAEPHQLLVLFVAEDSCRRAMDWCNAQRGLCAEFGFTRYCVKFINKRECKRKECSLRHSFVESLDDVLSDPKGDSETRRLLSVKVTKLQREFDALLKLRTEQTSQAQFLMNAIADARHKNNAMRRSIESKSRLSKEQITALGLNEGFDLESIVDEMDAELSTHSLDS